MAKNSSSNARTPARRDRGVIVRNPDETLLTVNIPVDLKKALSDRSLASDRPMAKLVRWALEYQEKHGWKEIPQALPIPK